MKKVYFNPSLFLFGVSLLLLSSSVFGQLNGNYSINPTRSASSSNYQNWASAVGDLLTGSRTDGGTPQGAGVSGRVTITVYDSIYDNTNIELTAISGVSYTNTITFKSAGGDSSKCMLKFPSNSSGTTDYVLNINGADFITFQEIGFERTGTNTYCNVVVITNDADKNKLLRCFIKGKKQPSSSTLGFQYGPGSAIYFLGNADSTEITQNELMYGYNGIFSTSASVAITIRGNRIDTSGSSGIYMTYQTSFQILGNTFNMGDFGPGKGHYTSYGFRIEFSPSLIAANNRVFMSASNGQVVRAIVMANNDSRSVPPAMVYNNFILNSGGTTECTGFAVYGCYDLDIKYNNVLIINSLTNASAYYHYATYANTTISILNNNLINKGGGYALNVPGTNTGDIDSLDYNNLYSNGNYIGNYNSTNYSTFSGWKSGTGRDANSFNIDPGYTSNTNLHISNIKLNGKALIDSRINSDIDGDARDNGSPDIGADEFFPVTLDAGVANLDSPLLFCAGSQKVKVSFQNYGFDTIKSLQIQWQINGSTQSPYSWTGKLAAGESSASINIGSFTFSANTSYKFKIWTRIPNNKSDGKPTNDTLNITRMPAMSGNYSLGDTSIANYKSFNQAITAMTSRGICGATTFKVFKGTYNEQLTLVQLPGMGSSSPITFENISTDSTKVLISLASTTATGSNNAAIQLRGANYVTFKGITFERTSTNPIGHVLHILNGAHHNTFVNCQMLGLNNGTAANGQNIWSDQGVDNFNIFRKNYVRFGYNNMLFLGTTGAHETGNVLDGNIFENAVNNSVVIQFNDSITVKGNIFQNVNAHIVGNYDIQLNDCDKGINANGNFFKSSNTDTSLWLLNCNATAGSYGIVANNAAIRTYGKAIFLDGVDYQNIVFNSIYFNSNNTTNAAITTSASSATNLVLKNNNIVMDGGEVFHIATPSSVIASDNNNFFIKGTQFAYWGAPYGNLAALRTASGMDAKSLTINPLFTSAIDLHIKNYLLKGKGQPITGVTTDFDGETRHATTPDIGADEFELTPNDGGVIALIKPIALTCAGPLDVRTVIKNFGKNNIKTATINWSINGVVQSPYAWKGDLITNATDTVTIGNFNFTTIFTPRFIIKIVQPNGQPDGLNFNDSISVTRALRAPPNANLGADLIICNGDSVTIGYAPGTGLNYKWFSISNTLLATTSELTVKPIVKTKYIIEVTSATFGCTNRDTVEVDVNTKPIADAGKDQTICPNTTVQIGATSQSGFSYSWLSQPAGFTSSIANPTDNPSITTKYIIEKTVAGSGCKDLDTVVITLAQIPTPAIQGKDYLCESEIQNYYTTAGNNYKWLITGGKILSGQNTNSINVEWTTAGIGILQVVETNTALCFDTAIYYVTVALNPKADFSFNSTCLSNITNFTNLSMNGQTYAWTFGDGTNSTLKDPAHAYPQAISYNVRLIAKNSFGCNDTVTKLLPIDPLPIANFTSIQKAGNTLEFTNTSTILSGLISTWSWKFGDGDTSILQNPTHKYASAVNATITLCVKSSQGCEGCTTKVVSFAGIRGIISNPGLYIYPNPGLNIFNIISTLPMSSIVITNSLGQIIETHYPGSLKFEFSLANNPSGVYFIKIGTDGQSRVLRIVKE